MLWLAMHVKPRTEKKVAAACRRLSLPHYLPLRVKNKIFQRRKVTTTLPLFPGYVFACLTPEDRLAMLKTNHVVRFLAPTRPYRLLRQLVQIRRALRSDPEMQAIKPLTSGKRVRVISGPFLGMEGVVTRLSSKMRVHISVELIGQAIAVVVERPMVEVV